MQPSSPPTGPQFEISRPQRLGAVALLGICSYGLLLIVPVFVAMLAVSVIKFGVITFALPIGAIIAASYFLPFGFGNSHVARLLAPLKPAGQQQTFLVQLTFSPRLRQGLRALVEDADDLGWLTLTESEVVFTGDSVRLRVPYDKVRRLRTQSIGWRGFFFFGPATRFEVDEWKEVRALKFADRSASLWTTSHKRAGLLYRSLREKLNRAEPAQNGPGSDRTFR